jgi:hypothetical protein
MATTTTTTNKPLNPRAQDLSPKGYNRAALYSGKALDFDGVNDDVTIPNSDSINITGNALTIAGYINTDGSASWQGICYKDSGNLKGFQLFVDKTGDPNIAFGIHTGGFYRLYSNEVIENNKWYFVVATYDGTNQSIYINGVFDNSQAATGNITDSSAENLYIGRNTVGSERFNGEIGGFKIFNTALTAAQVADLYLNPEKIVPDGVADSALKLWLPMMEGAGTMCVNGAPDALGSELVTNGDFDTDSDWTKGTGWSISGGTASCDGSQSGNSILYQGIGHSANKLYQIEFTISGYVSGQIDFALDTPFFGATSSNGTFIFSAIPPSGGNFIIRANSTFVGSIDNVSVKEVQNSGVISGATWTHGIGAPVAQTSVIDWNKHTLDGTNEVLVPQGLTSGRDLLGNLFESARNPYALNLDGASWAEVHDNASLDFGTGSFSLEIWSKAKHITSGSIYNVLLTLGGNVSSGSTSSLYIDSSLNYTFRYDSTLIVAGGSSEGDWSHVVGVYDGTNINIYLNGSFVVQTAASATSKTNTFAKVIGSDDTAASRTYKDQLALPRIYNRALTATEVLRNYNADKSKFGL